ncbi:MAG: winged helix-turn-helix transcriptional regulator [Bacillota bacterium]
MEKNAVKIDSRWKLLIELSKDISGRWTVPILVSINVNGDRFTPLQTKTGAAPARLSENLKKMCDAGLLHHISPYERRHPLLPEYILTEKGLLYRDIALAVYYTSEKTNQKDSLYKEWNLPIVFSILNNKNRFQEIKNELITITSKTLSARLNELQAKEVINKEVISLSPVITNYILTDGYYKPVKGLAEDILSII